MINWFKLSTTLWHTEYKYWDYTGINTVINVKSRLEIDRLRSEEGAQALVQGIVRCGRGARF
ncbi:hypothetical protein BDV93DRAFT_527773 [Ceratobasidium sp. AG-I]|nr:hypothetical protein BDV93DRAFT_527772 [Ceratobasidium sp. AG-I]KAF8596901.1 hypothetical protein BDV93DRAFT_527773 [Ceratobasidium sp. AG-I]